MPSILNEDLKFFKIIKVKAINPKIDPVEVGDEREEVVPGVALSKKMAHCGDNINLSIKFPELRVFTCNEKQGIKPLTTYVIDEENLASKTEKVKILLDYS